MSNVNLSHVDNVESPSRTRRHRRPLQSWHASRQRTLCKWTVRQTDISNSKGLNDVDESKAKSEAEEKAVRALTNSKEFGPEQYGGHAGGRDKGHEERHNERFDEERRAEKRAF